MRWTRFTACRPAFGRRAHGFGNRGGIRRISCARLVGLGRRLCVLLALGAPANAQTPEPRLISLDDDPVNVDLPVDETWVAVGPERVIQVSMMRGDAGFGLLAQAIDYAIAKETQPGVWAWTQSGRLTQGGMRGHFDPCVAAADNGDFYVVALNGVTQPRVVGIRYNGELGAWDDTWATLAGPTSDKTWIVAGEYQPEQTGSGGEITSPEIVEYYLTYTVIGAPNSFGYLRSVNGGKTWKGGPVSNISGPVGRMQPTVAGSGPVYAAYLSRRESNEFFEVSFLEGTDIDSGPNAGEVSWSHLLVSESQPLVVTLNHWESGDSSHTIRAKLPGDSGEVDVFTVSWLVADPTDGDRLFFIVHDTATNSASDNDVNIYSQVLTRNPSTGYWSIGSRVQVNDDDTQFEADQFLPSANYDAQGRLHVVWYDDRDVSDDPATDQVDGPQGAGNPRAQYDVYYAFSNNGGASFQPNSELAESDPDIPALRFDDYYPSGAPAWQHRNRPGDYNGVAARDGIVWTSFHGTDSDEPSTSNPSVIWAAQIPFGP